MDIDRKIEEQKEHPDSISYKEYKSKKGTNAPMNRRRVRVKVRKKRRVLISRNTRKYTVKEKVLFGTILFLGFAVGVELTIILLKALSAVDIPIGIIN
ncbi:MAG: hypothetical protein E7480_03365 [Ruminococcaceae bacterium]|nr:hypothetical protein [Oscillospiraceae bacterium]